MHEEAPRLALNLPGKQSEHDTVPFLAVYRPGAHARHIDSFEAPSEARYLPAVQFVHDVAPVSVVEYFPAAQLTQTEPEVAPTTVLCFPAAHSRHVCTVEAPTDAL